MPDPISTVRRWWLLTVGLVATLCATVFINGIAFLIPALDAERGISLAEAGLLASMPSLGMVVTLIAWGYLLDRVGERLGAVGRIGAARWSDRVGSRMRPIRVIAVGAGLTMSGLGLCDQLNSPLAVPLVVAAAVITVLDNGLAFTAIPEIAGPYWSGRAMGAKNTSQRLTARIGPPVFGEVTDVTGYPLASAVCGLVALTALAVVSVGARRRARTVGK